MWGVIFERNFYNLSPPLEYGSAGRRYESVHLGSTHFAECGLQCFSCPHVKHLEEQSELASRGGGFINEHSRRRLVRINEQGDPAGVRNQFLDKLQAFSDQLASKGDQARCIAARPRKTFDQFKSDRVGNEHEYDRDVRRRILQIARSNGSAHQHIRVQRDKFSGHTPETIGILIWKTMLKNDITLRNRAVSRQPLEQS